MKKVLFIIVALLLGIGSAWAAEDVLNLTIKNPPTPGSAPRMPAVVPISAYVSGTCLYISFVSAVGETDVEIVCEESGEVSTYALNGTDPAVLPISGESGNYTITFTLGSGVECYGEFTL